MNALFVGLPPLPRKPLVCKAAVDALALHHVLGDAGTPVMDGAGGGVLDVFLIERVGHTGGMILVAVASIAAVVVLSLPPTVHMLTGRLNGAFSVGLRGQRDEGNVGDLEDGLSAYLGHQFPVTDGDEKEGGCDLEQACACALA